MDFIHSQGSASLHPFCAFRRDAVPNPPYLRTVGLRCRTRGAHPYRPQKSHRFVMRRIHMPH
jgi:hypothetical protein